MGRGPSFFNDTATTESYTLSLPDALPILALFLMTMATLVNLAHRRPPAKEVLKTVRLLDPLEETVGMGTYLGATVLVVSVHHVTLFYQVFAEEVVSLLSLPLPLPIPAHVNRVPAM